MRTGLSSGATAESSSSSLSLSNKVVLRRSGSRTVTTLAIGNPDLAPYGVAARNILGGDGAPADNMGLWDIGIYQDAGKDVSSSCSSYLTSDTEWICFYSNIDNTLKAIDGDKVTGGFVSYAQICDVWAGTGSYPAKQYVKFPDYPTSQDYIELVVSSSSARSHADAFLAGLKIGGSDGSWNTWLVDNCYLGL
jgi:ABC-type molybdate transport system substrate-binding protein